MEEYALCSSTSYLFSSRNLQNRRQEENEAVRKQQGDLKAHLASRKHPGEYLIIFL